MGPNLLLASSSLALFPWSHPSHSEASISVAPHPSSALEPVYHGMKPQKPGARLNLYSLVMGVRYSVLATGRLTSTGTL